MNFRIEYRNTVLVSIDKVLNCTHVLPVYQFHAWIYISPFNNSLNFEQIQSVFKKAAGPLWLMPPRKTAEFPVFLSNGDRPSVIILCGINESLFLLFSVLHCLRLYGIMTIELPK